MGRSTKFTQPVKERILEALSYGSDRKTAAQYAGIGYNTLLRWLKEGSEESSGAKSDFVREVEQTEAGDKIEALRLLKSERPNRPDLVWKYVERRVPGFAPPQPAAPQVPNTPVVISLSFAEGKPAAVAALPDPDVIEGEVVDEQTIA